MAHAIAHARRRLLIAAALLAAAGSLVLFSTRGEASTPLTLKTITIDGSIGDWDAVLANPLQTTRDGDGSSSNITANCPLYSTDRDCPMGGGAGNDLYSFAWTYDASFVYLYIERYGSSNNGVDFFFLADIDQDQRLEATGDKVIHARWWGSTGNVTVDAGGYVPVDTLNGDPIASATGYVDGYDLPGTNGALTAISCALAQGVGVTAGADGGRKMELRIPWCAFGIPAQQPFYWHVVSTNNGQLNTPLDNIGAPSGGIGTFVQRAVAFFPDRNGAVLSPGTVTYDHTLRNDGNESDVFQFTATSSQGGKIELLDDLNNVIGRDDQGDGTWELAPQVSLAIGASKTLHVRLTLPSGRTGQDVTRVTAVSTNDATVSATVTDWTHVGSPAFVPETFSSWTQAGVAAGFAEMLANGQLAEDTFDLTPDAGCAGDEVRLTLDSAGAQLVARDDTGDGSWDFVDPAYDSNANLLPDRAVPGTSTKPFWLWVTPPPSAPNGSCTLRLTATSPTTGATAHADHALTVAPAVAFGPSYTRLAGTSLRAGVGSSVYFPAVIRNSESVSRAYDLTQVLSPAASGATARVWSDPDGDGSPSDGQPITTTGSLSPFGGTQAVVVELLAGTAAAGTALSIATAAVATVGGATATQSSEADVGYVATYADALLTQATSVFPPCAPVHVHGSGLLSGDTSSYTLTWLTPTATTARQVQPWPTTLLGTADDSYTLEASAPTGSWTARLVDGPSTRDQNLSFTVELNASVASLATDKARYRPGDVVLVTGTFRDSGRAALEAGSFHYALDGVGLRTRSGVTVAAGGTVSDPFTFTLPPGTAPGVLTLSAGWWLSCGSAAFASRNLTFEVQSDAPVITSPADGARLADATPTLTGTAVAFASVTVQIGATTYPPVTADGAGAWSFTPPALADGSWTATATQSISGVTSDPSPAVSFEIDVTPPAVPAVAAIGSPTKANPVVVQVTAPGATSVTVYRDGATLSTTPASVSGDLFTFELSLAEGSWSIQATASDALLNMSALSAARAVTVDRTPPPAPQVTAYAAPRNDLTVPVTATAEAGSVVKLYVDGAYHSTLVEGPAGTFTGDVSPAVDGSYDLTATATDAADNVSAASGVATLVIDRSPPGAPVVSALVPLSPTKINADPVPIVVTAEAGATVVLVVDGVPRPTLVPTFTAPDQYRFDVSLTTGVHGVAAAATDAAGNSNGVPSNEITLDVDLLPPAVPTVQPIATPTSLQPVPITVNAEAGSTIAFTANGSPAAATLVSASGSTYSFTMTLAEGTFSIRATAADPLGNTSAPSPAVSVTVDRAKPAAPTVSAGIPTVTNVPLVTVTGTAEAGSSVSATVTGTGPVPAPAAVPAAGGAFSIDLDFLAATSLDGTFQVVLRATDAAGNVSDPTVAANVTLDRVAPDAPVIPAIPESASPVVIHVSAEGGSTVVLSIDGTPHPELLPASVIATDYSFQVPLADGGHSVEATATDAAGNTSAPSTARAFTVNSTIPATPTVSVASWVNVTTFPVTVTADAAMTVVLYVGGVDSGLTPTVTGGTSYGFTPTRGEGQYVLTAKAMNGSGTWSAESAAKVVNVDTTPPAAPPTIAPALPALTNAASLTVAGATEPYATVTVRVAGATVATTTADAAGSYSVSAALPAAEGSYGVTVQAADRAGNTSSESAPVTVQVDRTGPAAAPTIAPALPARTNDGSLTVGGETEPYATVTIVVTGMPPVTTTADAAGAYSAFVPLPAAEGTYDVAVSAEDPAGNPAAASTTATVVVDTTPPATAPTIAPALPALTSAASIAVAGVTEANATVTVQVAGMTAVTTTADAGGSYSVSAALPAADGWYDVTVKATDVAGNDSPVSAPVTVQVDRTAPATAPTIAPALPALTNAANVTVAGVTEANATVTVRVAGMAAVTTTADASGRYSVSAALPAADGSYGVTVQAADLLGNLSPVSAPVTVQVDRTGPPTAPTIAPALPALTNAASVTVAGVAEANATVTVQVTGMTALTTTADASGNYSVIAALPAADGSWGVTVKATDVAGNDSPVSAPVTVQVDRTGPAAAPTIAPSLPTRTNAASLTVAGGTEANATVTVQVAGMAAVTTTADELRSFPAVPALPLADGSYGVTVKATDVAGNDSPVSAPVGIIVDRSPPASAPTMDPLPTLTNAASVTVSGTTEANATVTVQVTGMTAVTTTADASGNYSVVAALPAADGSWSVTVKATDVAGNDSPVSTPVTVQVDRTGPATAPTIAPALPSLTNVASVTVSGSTEPNATVTVLVNGALAVTTSADGAGAYSVGAPLPPADGAYSVQVRAADLAGNASPLSAASTVVLDRTGPATPPTIAPALPALTNAASIAVAGVTEANATVTVQVAGMTAVTTTADASGNYSVVAPLPATDGSHDVTVKATDVAGNDSPVSTPVTVQVDRAAPSQAVIDAPAAGASVPPGTVSIAGTAEAGATVTLTVDGTPYDVTADGATGAFRLDVTLAEGNHAVSATVADAAGNVSTQVDVAFVVAYPPTSVTASGCGCGPGGASSPEALLLVIIGLAVFRRRRAP